MFSFLELVAGMLAELWCYMTIDRALAWLFAILAAIGLVVGLSRPSEYWFCFVLCPVLAILSYASIWIGDRWEGGSYDRELKRERREQRKNAPSRGFDVIRSRKG